MPFFFRSSQCNVPDQFRAACIPTINGDPFAQDVGSYDPEKGPLFNTSAFENPNDFNFYYGNGDRITSYRQQSYRNQDISLIKNTKLGDRVNLQLRISAFNVWNWHVFTTSNQNVDFYSPAFDTDIASPDFGQWTGSVSNPRNIQLSARLEF